MCIFLCTCTLVIKDGNQSAPVLLWLQGGPGGSSLFGLFNEHGPLEVDDNGMPLSRRFTWNSIYHLLYIDNPVRKYPVSIPIARVYRYFIQLLKVTLLKLC